MKTYSLIDKHKLLVGLIKDEHSTWLKVMTAFNLM